MFGSDLFVLMGRERGKRKERGLVLISHISFLISFSEMIFQTDGA